MSGQSLLIPKLIEAKSIHLINIRFHGNSMIKITKNQI